jgi:hypothetical protein
VGKHHAPHGQPGQLPGGDGLAIGRPTERGRHRDDQTRGEAETTVPVDTVNSTEGWRH